MKQKVTRNKTGKKRQREKMSGRGRSYGGRGGNNSGGRGGYGYGNRGG